MNNKQKKKKNRKSFDKNNLQRLKLAYRIIKNKKINEIP